MELVVLLGAEEGELGRVVDPHPVGEFISAVLCPIKKREFLLLQC